MPKTILLSTESTDNYLKAVFELTGEGQRATTTEISRRLGVSAASVTGMLKKLAASTPSLVTYEKRRGAELTSVGEGRAVEVIRHHRLIESYLHSELGYRWDEVHQEAEKLEHFISEDLEDRMAAKLGDPEFDPHGHPIPRKDGSIPKCDDAPLRQSPPGSTVRVSRVSDEDPSLLRYLTELGVGLNAQLDVLEHAPFDGPTMLRRERQDAFPVSASIAIRVRVVIEA